MFRFACRFMAVVVATAAFLNPHSAQAFRHFRLGCRSCWQRCESCRPCVLGDDYTCLMSEVYEFDPHDIIYSADYYQGDCYVTPETQYYEGDSQTVPQECPNCILGGFYGRNCKGNSTKLFRGLPAPLNPTFSPPVSNGCTVQDQHGESFSLTAVGKTFKVEVYAIWVSKLHKDIYVAYEIANFSQGENPATISLGQGNCKKLPGDHAYVLSYGGRSILLLTAN